MNMDHFVYFIEAVKKQSFTKAAESLFISQSTISKAIRSLEKEYETELIDRTSNRFKLTSAGEIFYHSAVKIVSNYKSEVEVLSVLLHSRRGTLTLAIPPVTITVVHAVLRQYQHMYPNIQLRVSELGAKSAYSLTKTGTVDMSILIQPFVDPDFIQIPFLHSEVVCAVAPNHRLANYGSITFSQLSQESFYVLDKTFMLYDNIIESCQQAGFLPHIVRESAQWDLLIEAVSDGEGITLLPKPIIDKFCSKTIVQLHMQEPTLPWIPTIAYHREKFISTPMKLFLDMIYKLKDKI